MELKGERERCCCQCSSTNALLWCHECLQDFCFAHLVAHQRQIGTNLDELINEEKRFVEQMEKKENETMINVKIDQWKKQAIEKIKELAKEAKEEVKRHELREEERRNNEWKAFEHRMEDLQKKEGQSEKEIQLLRQRFDELRREKHSLRLHCSLPSNTLLTIEHLDETPPPIPLEPPKATIKAGPLVFVEVDRFGHYVSVENIGLKMIDLVGWTIQGGREDSSSSSSLLYRFPCDCYLPAQSSLKILSQRASSSVYSFEKSSCLVACSIVNWLICSPELFRLIDPQGKERDVFIRK